MFCRNCGKMLDDKAIICPQCGTDVTQIPNRQANQTYNNTYQNNGRYGQTGYYPNQNAPRPASKENTIAIVGFALSFFFAIVGLVCSIIGYNKAKNEGYDNKGLAIAGIVISSIEIAGSVLFLIFYLSIIIPMLGGLFGGIYY